jgi:hypothetical protein
MSPRLVPSSVPSSCRWCWAAISAGYGVAASRAVPSPALTSLAATVLRLSMQAASTRASADPWSGKVVRQLIGGTEESAGTGTGARLASAAGVSCGSRGAHMRGLLPLRIPGNGNWAHSSREAT